MAVELPVNMSRKPKKVPAGRRAEPPARPTRRQLLVQAAKELSGRDPVLKGLVDEHGPPTLRHATRSAARFASLAESIVYQQLNGKAAATIHGRVVERLGGPLSPDRILATDVADLRACGLSAAKTTAIVDLAQHVATGALELEHIGRLPDDEVVRQLVQVKGIGTWTAEMFLMFTLGRLDVWPVGDYGVRAGYGRAWGLAEMPSAKELEPLGDRFRPYRSVAAWYCWRVLDTVTPG